MARFMGRKSVASLLSRVFPQESRWSAMVEIADRCNETCVHCYQIQGRKGELPTHDWKRIFDELADMGVLFLTISGGEATLRADFLELVAYAREKQFAVKLYTNGLSMTQELASELQRLAVQEVQISLYSHRAEAHDWVTGVPGSWERTVAGIRHLRAHGVFVMIKTPLMKVNQHEFADFVRFADELDVDYSIDPKVNAREDGNLDSMSMAPDYEQIKALRRDARFQVPKPKVTPRRELHHRPCGACEHVHIEANGEIRACASLTVPLGNALEDGVRAAQQNNSSYALIRRLTWGDIRGCRVCDLRSYCGRCYSDSLQQGGDALAPYQGACRRTLITYEERNGPIPRRPAGDASDSPPDVGPFRLHADGSLEAFDEPETEADVQLRAEHPWLRNEATPSARGDAGLVQLRRPGRTSPVSEPMPVSRPCGNS